MNTIKKIALTLAVILVPYFGYKQYTQYVRFSPPSSYDYAISSEIDKAYYNPETVQKLHKAAFEVGNLARNYWYENQIDVRLFDGKDSRYSTAIGAYNDAKATAAFLEQKLIYSAQLKKAGFSNDDIQFLEESGVDSSQYVFVLAQKKARLWNNGVIKSGDNHSDVYHIQKMLKDSGKEMKADGYFEAFTKAGVEAFQKENGIYVTGIVNDLTYALLVEKTMAKNKWKK